jgi:8-oxo-dGTP pyrophosphatase MutT (NUDIX family)
MYGTVAGMYETKKHSTPLQAAQFELEEEAHLRSNNWHVLLDNENFTVPIDKYSTNQFYAYLALDCEEVEDPKSLDDEEYIIIERNIPYSRLMELINTGQINMVSSYAILLALRKLTQLGIPLE